MSEKKDGEVLAGEGITLRLIEPEDTDDILRWRNSDRVRKNFIYQEPFTREGHLLWQKEMIEKGLAVQFIIMEGRYPVGSVYLRDISLQHKKAEYGIFIGEARALCKGYGTEAARLMLNYAFKRLNLHKVFLRVLARNTPAIRSYRKAGFVQEGYLRDEVYLSGRFEDIILMAAVKPEQRELPEPDRERGIK